MGKLSGYLTCATVMAMTMAVLLAPAAANAAELIGSPLTGNPTNGICGGCDASAVQIAGPTIGGLPLSPTQDGVIVSARIKHSFTGGTPGDTFGITLLTGIGGTVFRARQPGRLTPVTYGTNLPAGTTEIVPKDADGTPHGVRITTTDRLGLFEDNSPGQSGPAVLSAVVNAQPVAGAQTNIALGVQSSGQADYSIPLSDVDLLVQASVEPDADGDEYGDQTQDRCPAQADTQGDCDTTAPTPDITKGPKKKTESQKARFRFASDDPSAAFQCRLDKKPFTACTSPKKYRKLKDRKHTFRVQATDSHGNVGPIDSFRWRVVD